MPSGQRPLPLGWLPLLSSTSPIRSGPVCRRNSSRKRSKQTPSTWGRNSTKQVPLTGSTAAYSQNQWYWWSWIQGGRLPNGHHSRRCVTFRPNRASSIAKTRCTASRDTVACSSFFKGRLLGGAGGLAVMRAASLQLGLAPAEQLGDGVDAVADVPSVAQVGLGLVQPADVAGPHLGLQALPGLRRDALHQAAALRRRHQGRQTALAVAPPPALGGARAVAQGCRGLDNAGRALLLDKPKQPHPVGSALVPGRLLRRLQLGDVLLDQQRVSGAHGSASRPALTSWSKQKTAHSGCYPFQKGRSRPFVLASLFLRIGMRPAIWPPPRSSSAPPGRARAGHH